MCIHLYSYFRAIAILVEIKGLDVSVKDFDHYGSFAQPLQLPENPVSLKKLSAKEVCLGHQSVLLSA